MTLEDWVTLSVIWWSGDKRRAIADWLSEHAHRRTCVTSEMTLQGLLADIDRVQSATLDVSAARARAVVALGAAPSRGISVVSWAAEDYPTRGGWRTRIRIGGTRGCRGQWSGPRG